MTKGAALKAYLFTTCKRTIALPLSLLAQFNLEDKRRRTPLTRSRYTPPARFSKLTWKTSPIAKRTIIAHLLRDTLLTHSQMAFPTALSPAYLLQVQLLKTSNPCVLRTLCVPGSSTFKSLHIAILAAFDWSFEIGNAWFFSVLVYELLTTGLLPENIRVLLTIFSNESALNDSENELGISYECGEVTKLSDIFEAFCYRDRPLAYFPENDGAMFSIHVLGKVAMDTMLGIDYIGGQGHTLYEDWDSQYGGRSSWKLNNDVVSEHVSQVNDSVKAELPAFET